MWREMNIDLLSKIESLHLIELYPGNGCVSSNNACSDLKFKNIISKFSSVDCCQLEKA